MINLLPKEIKKDLRAGRMNVILRRYLILLGLSTIFMLSIFAAGYYITTQERESAKQELADLEVASTQYAPIKTRAENFEKDLSIAKKIVSSEITFSDLIVDIAKILPPGTVLSDLNLTTNAFGETVTINARTNDANGGLRLKSAFQKSPYFDNVSIQTITSPAEEESDTISEIQRKYPYTVVMNATLLEELKTQTKKASE